MTDYDNETGEMILNQPRQESPFRDLQVQDVIPPNMQLTQRQVSDLFGSVQVAQLVPVPRNVEHVMKKMTVLAAQFGDKYVYSWDVKKKGGGVDTIEGGTVDLAYDLAREYGNNCTDVRQIETPSHLVFYARFTDLETGYTTTRAFQQRKNQTAGGRMDADRQLDITYQIGQSKAIRNVILKALNTYAEYCIEEAKKGMYDKIKKDPDKYLSAIDRGLEKFEISLVDVERQVNRTKANWTIRDIANIFAKLKSVDEGMASPRDAFPVETPTMATPTATEAKPRSAEKKKPEPVQEQKETTASDGDGAAVADREDAAEAGTVGSAGNKPPVTPTVQAEKKAPPKERPRAEKEPEPEQAQKTGGKKPAVRPKALFDQE